MSAALTGSSAMLAVALLVVMVLVVPTAHRHARRSAAADRPREVLAVPGPADTASRQEGRRAWTS